MFEALLIPGQLFGLRSLRGDEQPELVRQVAAHLDGFLGGDGLGGVLVFDAQFDRFDADGLLGVGGAFLVATETDEVG